MPLPKVKGVSEAEVFKVLKSGKTRRKCWKRMVTKVCYVGDGFTRKPPKYERFIRPMVSFLVFCNIFVSYLGIVSSFTNLNKTFILSCKFCRLVYALIKLDKGLDVETGGCYSQKVATTIVCIRSWSQPGVV